MDLSGDAPCPCGRGKPARSCCIRSIQRRGADGALRWERGLVVPQADTRPPAPSTGEANPKCYASPLKDCAGDIEGEHYISAAVLRRLSGPAQFLHVAGYNPKTPTDTRRLHVNSLTANILCARHNRILSPIDSAAMRAFDTLATLGDHFDRTAPQSETIVAVNGHDFERWLLKWFCGWLAAAKRPIPEPWIQILFGRGSFIEPRGLYVYASVGDLLGPETTLQFEHAPGVDAPHGCAIRLLNHEFILSMNPTAPTTRAEHVGKLRIYRPESFIFTHATTRAALALFFSWHDTHRHVPIDLSWSEQPMT